MQSRKKATRKLVSSMPSGKPLQSASASTDLYDLWLNSKLPFADPSMDAGVTSSSSHQLVSDLDASTDTGAENSINSGIDSERLAETLMQLSFSEMMSGAVEERL